MTTSLIHGTKPESVHGGRETTGLDRRSLLIGGAATAAALAGWAGIQGWLWPKKSVFIAAGQSYDVNLAKTIEEGLLATGVDPIWLRGRRVLLKPNMVEPVRTARHMTTHPAVVSAAAEVFQRWGAAVIVGEGPGHLRDTEHALIESGIQGAIQEDRLPFADLNYEEVAWTANCGRASKLAGFFFPRTVHEVDLIVSLPKLKTHHWVGMTASLKNMYGVIPGIKYGWPKNVLHFAGIPKTVVDINASLPKTIAIVDAIECMEGDGPILGSRKDMGLLIMGTNPTAVDATCARLMGLDPKRVTYLKLCGGRLGPVHEWRIEQRGEPWRDHVSPFKILDRPHLRELGADPGVYIT